MPSIPSLVWKEQKRTPGVDDTQLQLVGCPFCPGDNIPPGTVFLIHGTAVCYEHIKDAMKNV